MKPDTERKKYYNEKNHMKRNHLRMHLSKYLQGKLNNKRRSLLARKDDKVRVMRGPGAGKEGKITSLNIVRRKAYVEGVSVTNARGKEIPLPLEPSNLLLTSLGKTEEREKLFSEEAFKKLEKKKELQEPPKEGKPSEEATQQSTEGRKSTGDVEKQEPRIPLQKAQETKKPDEEKPSEEATQQSTEGRKSTGDVEKDQEISEENIQEKEKTGKMKAQEEKESAKTEKND